EHGKLIDYLFLYLLYRHVSVLFKSTTRQIVRQVFMIKITSWSKEHTFGLFYCRHQFVHFLLGIVKAETGTHCSRNLIKIHDGLRTMVPRPDRYSQFVENS